MGVVATGEHQKYTVQFLKLIDSCLFGRTLHRCHTSQIKLYNALNNIQTSSVIFFPVFAV